VPLVARADDRGIRGANYRQRRERVARLRGRPAATAWSAFKDRARKGARMAEKLDQVGPSYVPVWPRSSARVLADLGLTPDTGT
jgi:hypothetical protein